MPKIELKKRLKFAGDVFAELMKMGWSCTDATDFVNAFRDADAVEVVHGEWVKTQEPLGWRDVDCVECSACHDSWIIDEDYEFDDFGGWKYCPNCGAKMDGERKETDEECI